MICSTSSFAPNFFQSSTGNSFICFSYRPIWWLLMKLIQSFEILARARHLFAESPVSSPPVPLQNTEFSPPAGADAEKGLTQKEYLIAVRNRLFSVEEQIWLHDFSIARPGLSKMSPLSDGKYNALLRARGELMDEYPVTKLYTDLMEAQQRNMSYAAMYLERLICTFNRQLPISMLHINQIAVISDRGRVVNLMRGQGNVYHRLVPSSVTTEKDVTRQFQHPVFSTNGKYVAFSEMHFKEKGNENLLINVWINCLFSHCHWLAVAPIYANGFYLLMYVLSNCPCGRLGFWGPHWPEGLRCHWQPPHLWFWGTARRSFFSEILTWWWELSHALLLTS